MNPIRRLFEPAFVKSAYICMFLMLLVGSSATAQVMGRSVLDLAPGDNNPRNSEGDFISLKNGRILFIYSHYTGGSTSDHAPAHLASRYSDNGGKTWSQKDEVIVENEGGMNVMSVSLLRLQNGQIALFYVRKNSEEDCIPMIRISNDEAKTWSDPVTCITDRQGYFVLNNSRVIQLRSGRLLMPVALHKIKGGAWNNKATLYSYYSDDNGLSWKTSEAVPNNTDIITQEPGVVELKNGTVLMIIRASGGFQQLSFSKDKGQSWSHIEPSNIPSPISPATIRRIPKTNDLLLVWNNNGATGPGYFKSVRTPLTTAISKDDGKTWEKKKNIENDPDGWYCYIAVHFTGKQALLGYCAGSQSKKTHLSLTRINMLNIKSFYK